MDNQRKAKLEDVYRKHSKSLYHYLLRLTGSPSVAEDLVQETFYKATLSLTFYQDQEVRSWLFKVARHTYLDAWRKRKRWEWVPFIEIIHNHEDMTSPYEQPEDYLVSKESGEDFTRLFKQLTETYRTILYLRDEEGLSYKELSEALEMNENQVKVTLHRARKRLHQLASRHHEKERKDVHDRTVD